MLGGQLIEPVQRNECDLDDMMGSNNIICCRRHQLGNNSCTKAASVMQRCVAVTKTFVQAQEQAVPLEWDELLAGVALHEQALGIVYRLGARKYRVAQRADSSAPHLVSSLLGSGVYNCRLSAACITNHVYILSLRY